MERIVSFFLTVPLCLLIYMNWPISNLIFFRLFLIVINAGTYVIN